MRDMRGWLEDGEGRRYFVLSVPSTSSARLQSFPSEESVSADGAAGAIDVQDSLVLVDERAATLILEVRGSLSLTLRAHSEGERSAWVRALLAAGAAPHPATRYLAAHSRDDDAACCSTVWAGADLGEPFVRVPGDKGGAVVSSCSIAATGSIGSSNLLKHHCGRALIQIPEGLRAGEAFRVVLLSGRSFLVRIPSNASFLLETTVPTAFLLGSEPRGHVQPLSTGLVSSDARGKGEGGEPPRGLEYLEGTLSGRGFGGATNACDASQRMLCRKLRIIMHKPMNTRLGIGVATNRDGRLTVTNLLPGSIAAEAGTIALGDMLLSANSHEIADLAQLIDVFDELESGDVTFVLLRLEDEAALRDQLEQVAELEQERRRLLQMIAERQQPTSWQETQACEATSCEAKKSAETARQSQEAEEDERRPGPAREGTPLRRTKPFWESKQKARAMSSAGSAPPLSKARTCSECHASGAVSTAATLLSQLETNIAIASGKKGTLQRRRSASARLTPERSGGMQADVVYEAQKQFVLTQLRDPGVEVFFDSDDETDDYIQALRQNSKLV
ncbi:hypothetical protein AB1Y20_007889 [Prymnesium parvum]|uniref:PDZ domain-containing protein n=1 Tax=Prymnesium parvum TaxID=97485 RepID=A0AB34IV56_PRYPA